MSIEDKYGELSVAGGEEVWQGHLEGDVDNQVEESDDCHQ